MSRISRKAAIRRRRIFISLCSVLLSVLLFFTGMMISFIKNAVSKDSGQKPDSHESTDSDRQAGISDSGESTQNPEGGENTENGAGENENPKTVIRGDYELDAEYSRLLLVNAEYPLPEDYNYGWNLTKIEDKYHNGELNQIDAGVWPYMKAMVEAAWKDGVKLYVWSPYRSYATQKMLFENRVKKEGGDEAKAAQAVARPGTSEHNTGLCADFNMASSKFESTEMFTWMCKNAADYGFILRYPKDSIGITGVMYESWHWRFVGINRAKEINNLNVTLEEYIKLKGIDPQADLYKK